MTSVTYSTWLRWRLSVVGLMLLLSAVPAFAQMEGRIKVNGSSTVAPIMRAGADLFVSEHPSVGISIGAVGTTAGFREFLHDEPEQRTDINCASRPINSEEIARAEEIGVGFVEVPIAFGAVTVVVHPSNKFCDHLTVAELKKIWEPSSTVKNWSQVRSGFPDLPLTLYGPGQDSGTFDYFTEAIIGQVRSSRSDYTASEKDMELVRGVAKDKGSLGYFGYSYYFNNRDKLRAVAIDNGNGKAVLPSPNSILAGTYKPLGRPLFLYVSVASINSPTLPSYLLYIFQYPVLVVENPKVNYVALSEDLYSVLSKRVLMRKRGSPMAGADKSVSLEEIYGWK